LNQHAWPATPGRRISQAELQSQSITLLTSVKLTIANDAAAVV